MMNELLVSQLADVVFGSNAIEKAGASRGMTHEICRKVLRDEEVMVDDIDESSANYELELQYQTKMGHSACRNSLLKGRLEIIQHVTAMKYFLNAIVFRQNPLSEKLILDTHALLMQGGDKKDIGGRYRTSDCAATASEETYDESVDDFQKRVADFKKLKPMADISRLARRLNVPKYLSKFVPPSRIKVFMQKLIAEYNNDTEAVGKCKEIDHVSMATKYCHFFVCIHPFEDGNGRMCRLILNGIMLRHVGVPVALGVNWEERVPYTLIAYRGNQLFKKEEAADMPWNEQRGYFELMELVMEKVALMGV